MKQLDVFDGACLRCGGDWTPAHAAICPKREGATMTEAETRARMADIRAKYSPASPPFNDVKWLYDKLEAFLAAGTFVDGVVCPKCGERYER